MKCAHCGTESPSGMRYCGGCAAPLTPLGPAADSGLSDGERKLVTVLFADVAGFTALAEALDPEDVRDLLNSLFDRLVPCVERYGGTVDKFIGDEVMALFGAPTAHENDPERAVRCALDMRGAVDAFNSEWSAGLAIHVGINTGRVLAGFVGSGSGSAYSVMGDAVNVAARLTEAAGLGEILIGPDTARLAGRVFEFAETGSIEVKGREGPVVAHRVLGVRTRPEPSGRGGAGRLDSPLVGREAERAAFLASLDRLEAGRGGLLAIVGEAGLGKSRLVAEVRREAPDRGLTWLEGRSAAFGETVSYAPLLEILRVDSDISPDDDAAVGAAKLATRIAGLLGDQAEDTLPYLATLLSLPVSEVLADRMSGLGGEDMRRRIVGATRRYIAGLAAERPVVLVLEDVHWLDESSALMLGQLFPLALESPVLFCVVTRPDSGSSSVRVLDAIRRAGGDRHAEIVLSPLPVARIHELVRNLIGALEPGSGIEQVIETRAEGNPLFVEEVIRALIDLGGLEPDDRDGWRATARAGDISLPDTIESIIMTRVDRLGGSPRRVLKLASVIGRIFFYRVLAAVSGRGQGLADDLGELESVELIRERRPDPEKEYAFQHAVVQEATYESILVRQRRQLHREVAAAVELLYADRLEEFSSRLAYHYSRAEEWDKAREHLVRAGDQALSIAANAEAILHLERALEAQSALSRSRPDLAGAISPLERAALWRKVATLRVKQRRMADALAAVEEAEGELERGGRETAEWWAEWIEVELEKALALYFSRSGPALFALLETLGPILERWGTPVQKGQYLLRVASGSFVRERFRPSPQTLDHARAACELGVGSVREERVAFYGLCLLWADRLDEAAEVLADALSLAEEADDLMQRATALAYLACVERRRGDAARTAEFADRCLSAAGEGAVPLYQGVARANLAWIHWGRGDLPAAEREARDALVFLTNPAIVYAWTWLARWPLIGVLLSRGNLAEAVEHAAAMLEPNQQELPAELAQALVETVTAWGEGRSEDARDSLRAAHELADSIGYG